MQNTASVHEPYNGVPVREGEVLVPMVVDEAFIKMHDIKHDKIRTWSMAGIPYQVVFYAVPEEIRETAMAQYYYSVNELLNEKLGANRSSRCLVPQEDGSYRVCPKKRRDNRCACCDCPYHGRLMREDKAIASLDEMSEETELEMEGPDDTERDALIPLMLKDLLASLEKQDARSFTVLNLCLAGLQENEIISELMERLDVKQSRAYEIYTTAKKLITEYLLY